ncbi:uncharacterized protein LOC133184227 isoform X2 [Saccostrea echinata]|uniref:uncharacterized protein LOC133184227 isoform X2 n=1 Tax=Saccostrea echinata TaxID=191078 RepID=UPI002A8158EE|nr:uncharacterized protein LOC133184227 isoform X2 [Saccostrea echinata]XP_061175174.1 uncharacterized protein LOC133184227 isoform X2 [Saccostrea echinata]
MANKVLLVLLWITATVDCLSGRLYNMTNLLIQYTDYCGSDSVCSTMNIRTDFNSNYTPANICPLCSCTQDCEVNDECCLDKSLSTCVKTIYYVNGQRFIGNDEFKMITFCPEENNTSSKVSCFVPIDETNFVQQMPVYSVITNRTYVNIQCSKCHGEKETIQWPFSISCPFLNLNLHFYSDLGKIWKDIKRYNCSIEFTPVAGSYTIPCKKQSMIKECNVTGYWDKYDEDVEIACRNYNIQYGLFQNVFCFLCNTGTKQRHNKDKSIENVHIQQNIYQYTNRQTEESLLEKSTVKYKRRLYFTETEVKISEEYNFKKKKYTARVEFLSWDVVNNIEQLLSLQNLTYDKQVSEERVNLSALYEEYLRAGGYQDWCQENHTVNKMYPGFKSRRSCSCDRECYKTESCCPDVAYYQRWACKPAFLGSNAYIQSFALHVYNYFISKCPVNYTNYDIKLRCEQIEDYDMLYTPVINVQTNEAYKNHYCYFCHNQHKMASQNSTEVKAWNMKLVCPNFIFPEFISSMKKLLQTAKLLNCSITFTTENNVTSCTPSSQLIIGKCNVTGMATSVSENARIMCEDPTMTVMAKSSNYYYRNQICDLCNNKVYEEPISKCNLFGESKLPNTDNTSFRCEHGELDTRSYPFKNMYCVRCNPVIRVTSVKDNEWSIPNFSYRELFSIYRTVDKMSDISKGECSEREYYDAYKTRCRKLYCSRGKFLEKSSCIYLITHAEKVGYNLALRVMLSIGSEELSFFSTLTDLQTLIQQEIHEGELYVTEKYVYSNKSCDFLQMSSNQTSEEAIVYFGLGIKNSSSPINRRELELHFLNLTYRSFISNGVSVSFKESLEAWFLPLLIRQQLSNPHGCYFKSITSNSQITLDINKLLICTQIQLEEDEYVFSEDHTSIYVATINRNFKINEFLRSENNSVRICSDSYKQFQHSLSASTIATVMGSILMVVTYISTILSLLSLFLTFLIYCMLPVLRTVPGKNIMCFALSLFIAQLLFLVRSSIDDRTLCACVGGLTHYFWISVFTCTNVCCFHMFKLFVGNSLVRGDESGDRKLFITYCVISYLLPVFPIVINMLLEYGVGKSDQFGYGGSRCFLKSHLALLLTFICPIILQIIFNIVMFSITFHYIRNTPKIQSSQDRNDFSIFLKLFLLTGISWISMVVDGFFDISLFTFLATIINGLQGMFLFLSYVCNKKVFNMLRNRCGNQQESLSTSNRNSTSLVTGQKGQKRFYVNCQRDKNDVTDITEI